MDEKLKAYLQEAADEMDRVLSENAEIQKEPFPEELDQRIIDSIAELKKKKCWD